MRAIILLAVVLVIAVGVGVYFLVYNYVTPPDFSGQTKSLEARIVQMSMPRPGEPVKMGLFSSSMETCPDLVMSVDLGQAFELVGGQTEWRGKSTSGVNGMVFVVKPKGYGRFSITGSAVCRLSNGSVSDTVKNTYEIDADGTRVEVSHPAT